MWVRLTALIVWAVLAAAAVFWAFRLLVRPSPVPMHALPVAVDQSARGDPLRLFATPPAAVAAAPVPQASSRFKLLGVVAPKGGASGVGPAAGVALIAVDGKPARAYEVGAPVDGDWVLQSVTARGANIGPEGGAVVARLEVPALPTAATGTLPSVSNGDGTAASPGAAPSVKRPPTPAPKRRSAADGLPSVQAPITFINRAASAR